MQVLSNTTVAFLDLSSLSGSWTRSRARPITHSAPLMEPSELSSWHEQALGPALSQMSGVISTSELHSESPTGWQVQRDPAAGSLAAGDEEPGFRVRMFNMIHIIINMKNPDEKQI